MWFTALNGLIPYAAIYFTLYNVFFRYRCLLRFITLMMICEFLSRSTHIIIGWSLLIVLWHMHDKQQMRRLTVIYKSTHHSQKLLFIYIHLTIRFSIHLNQLNDGCIKIVICVCKISMNEEANHRKISCFCYIFGWVDKHSMIFIMLYICASQSCYALMRISTSWSTSIFSSAL